MPPASDRRWRLPRTSDTVTGSHGRFCSASSAIAEKISSWSGRKKCAGVTMSPTSAHADESSMSPPRMACSASTECGGFSGSVMVVLLFDDLGEVLLLHHPGEVGDEALASGLRLDPPHEPV